MASSSTTIDVGNLFSVKGMVALITGGGTGIGLMMAKALADAGAEKVYIVGRRLEVLQAAAQETGKPNIVIPLACDVTSKESLASVASKVEAETGYLNLLVCNSGIGGPQVKHPTPETSISDWADQQLAIPVDEYEKVYQVNCTAVWYTAMSFLKLLNAGNKKGNLEQSSHVVVTSSIGAFNKKAPGGWVYGQSKVAATHIVKQLSVTLPTWGIRANCLAPGLFPSEMSAPIVTAAGGSSGAGGGTIPLDKSIVPLGRMGDAKDMAGSILYLASRAGAYNNGLIAVVDGGRLGTFPSTGY